MLPGKKYQPADTLDVLRRSWGRLVTPILVCTFGGLVVSALLPNMYESDMLVQIIPQRVPDSYVRSTVTLKTEDRLGAVSQQVMSRTQLEQVIKDYEIHAGEFMNLRDRFWQAKLIGSQKPVAEFEARLTSAVGRRRASRAQIGCESPNDA